MYSSPSQDVFNTADPLPSEQTIQIYHNYLEEIEEDNHKRKLEDEEYEKRKQKLVSVSTTMYKKEFQQNRPHELQKKNLQLNL